MGVRTDDIQLRLNFITDESRALAETLKTTKQYTQEIAAASKRVQEHEKELKKAGVTEARRTELLRKIREEQNQIALAEKRIVEEGKKVEKLDLSKVAPVQLEARLRQIRTEMKLIADQSSPAFKALQAELKRVDVQLKEVYQTSKGGSGTGAGLLGNLGTFGAFAGRAIPVIGAVVGAFKSLGAAFSKASDLEQLTIAFETFLGSADKAKAVIADLKAFEVKTPFEADQVNGAGRALLAFGVTTKDLIPTLTRIGDVASGTGKDFNELTLIYGKAKTQGIIQGEELNQLAEAGIPIYAELAKVLGVNENQIRKLGEQGRIQFSDLDQVFKNLTGEGGRFAGLMERQSKSLGGLYSTLKSALGNLLTEVGNVLAPLAKRGLEVLIFAVEGLGKIARPVFDLFQWGFTAIANGSRSVAGFFSDTLPASITKFVRSADQIPVVGKALSVLLVPIRLVIDSFESMRATAAGVMASLEDIFTNGGRNIGKAYSDARNKALEEERQQAARDRAEEARDERQLTAQERAEQAVADKKAAQERADRQRKAQEERQKTFDKFLKTEIAGIEAQAAKRDLVSESFYLRGIISEERYQEALSASQERSYREQLDLYKEYGQEKTNDALEVQNKLLSIEEARNLRNRQPLAPLLNKAIKPAVRENGPQTADYYDPDFVDPDTLVRGNRQAVRLDTAKQTENTALAAAQNESDELQKILQDRFLSALISEQDYEDQRLELKRQFMEEELAILRASSEPQYEEIRKREDKKAEIELEIGKKRLENERRLEDLKQQTLEDGAKALGDVFSTVADMLSKDEKRKAKHAGIVKALEVANIQVNLVSEVSGIFANAQKSAVAKLLGPIAGNILAGVQAAGATLRAGVAIGKIQAQKFERGGTAKMGFFGGRPHSAGGTKGYFDDGTAIEVERDEAFAVINKRNAPMLRLLSRINAAGGHGDAFFERGGVPKFTIGGLPVVNTTPSASVLPALTATSSSGAVERLEKAAGIMLKAALSFPRTIEASVNYLNIEQAESDLSAVRDDAAL